MSVPGGRGVDGNQPNDNQITYTPATGAVGTDNFSIISDGDAANDSTVSVSITIAAVLPAPQPSSATVAASSTSNPISLSVNGGTATSLAISTQAGHGTATVSGITIAYTPVAGFAGPDSFQYTAMNAAGTSAPASVTITVTPVTPVVASLSPTTGATSGGNTVTISGSNFSGATAVSFGGTAASFIVSSATQITATAPAGSAGQVDVTVTTPSGTSVTGPADRYTYVAPTVAGVVSATVSYGSSANTISLNLSGGAATSVAVAPANHGTVTASGTSVTYTPTTGFFGSDSFTYTATNAAGTSSPATVSVAVSAPTIGVTPTTMTAGTVGAAYSHPLTASGGQAPYTFSTALVSGALPAGLTLATNGTIAGTPTEPGTFSFVVTGTDSSTATQASFTSGTISLTIDASVPGAPTIGTATAGNGQASVAFTAPASSGGAAITGYTVTASPGGFTGTGTTSPITVTGLTNGTAYTFTVKATNAVGTGAASAASNSITPLAPPVASAVFATVAYGSSANPITLSLSGGTPTSVAVATAANHGSAAASGTSITYTPTAGFFGTDSFTYTASNGSATSAAATVSVTISAPTIVVSPTTLGAGMVGTAYNQSLTASGGQSPYTLSTTAASGALPPGLTLASNGAVTGTPTTAGTFSFVVTGTDSSAATHANFTSATISLTVNSVGPGAPTIGTAVAGDAQASITFIAPTSDGGSAITGYTVTSSPGGITASGSSSPIVVTGLVNGTAYTFTVAASNGVGSGAASAASNSVTPLGIPVAGAVSATVPSGSTSNPITLSLSGGAATSVAVAAPPSHGTATASGTTIHYAPISGYSGPDSFTYTATNSSGTSSPANVSITVSPLPIATQAVASIVVTEGRAATSVTPVVGTSGVGALSYSVSPSLPAGLVMSAGAGAITGTATIASPATTYTVTVTDTNNATATAAFILTVNGAVTATQAVASKSLSVNQVAGAFTPITGSGGTGGLTYGVSPTLPTGLSMAASTGTITGTPTILSPATAFTVTVTDGNGAFASAAFSLTVATPSITLTPTTLANGVVAAPYSQTLSAAGGTAPYSFNVTTGTLPVGLALDASTGVLSGTPTIADAPSFTVTATDSNHQLGSATFTLTVTTPTVVAVAATEAIVAGGTVTVDLTAGATGGPFTAAHLVSLSPPSAGTAFITLGDTASNSDELFAQMVSARRFLLKFSAAPTFTGSAVATFTLTGAGGTSAPTRISFVINPRPDPSLDPEVVGLVNAQTDAAKRFASTQITNFNDRLEQLHDDRCQQNSWNVSVSDSRDNSRDVLPSDPFANSSTPGVDPAKLTAKTGREASPQERQAKAAEKAAEKDHDGCSPFAGGALAFWSGGFINFGSMSLGNSDSSFDFTTIGVSGGVDYRFSPSFTAGVGLGFGSDQSRIGDNGTRSDGKDYSAAIYGSYHPTPETFVDGLIGYGALDFDSKRYLSDTGGVASGSRNGNQDFASVTTGYEYRNDGLLLSPYGRITASRSDLDAFTETGGGWPDLHYGSQTVDTLTGFIGLRMEYKMPTDWGSLVPKARVEYGHDFAGNSNAALSYADQGGSQSYNLSTEGTGTNSINLDVGADMKVGEEWTFGFDYGATLGQTGGSVPQQVRINVGARF